MIRHDLAAGGPAMMIYRSRVDHVVGDRRRWRSSGTAYAAGTSRSSHLERSYHVATLDYDADLIFSGTSEFFTRLADGDKVGPDERTA